MLILPRYLLRIVMYTKMVKNKKCSICSFTSYQNDVTPLYMASQKGHRDVVKTLLEAGANVNIITSNVSDVMLYYFLESKLKTIRVRVCDS